MPSNKIITILIVCAGIVISIWLLQKNTRSISTVQNTNSIYSDTDQNTETTENTDWKNILVTVDEKNQNSTIISNQDEAETFDETTLTAKIAKDFFSQYLMLKKGGQTITPDEINRIAQNTLLLPEYTKSTGAVYLSTNLHINTEINTESLRTYRDTLNKNLKNRLGTIQTKEDPMTILIKAVKTDDEKEISKLDPIILAGKGIISDLLNMEVPKEVVTLHLFLLNASSNLLSNLEQMRVTLTDPVRSFAGANHYSKHITEFQTAITNLNLYLDQKLK